MKKMAKVSKKDLRTLKQKAQKRTYDYFIEEFYKFYIMKALQSTKDVMFAYNKKVDKSNVYAYFNVNQRYGSLMVYLNFKLVDEPKSLVKLTAQRMALKIALFKSGHHFEEMSKDYLAASKHFHIWNYGPYPETPQKWAVYKCAICGRNMAVFTKRLPNNNELTNSMMTPWHTKSLSSENTAIPHQGHYAFSGNLELKNSELQEILYIMHKSVEFTKNFTDNQLHYIQNNDEFDNFDF